MKRYKYAFGIPAIAMAGMLSSCDNGDPGADVYENRLYLDSSTRTMQLYVSTENTYRQTLTAAIAKPVDFDVHLTYKVVEELVDQYNEVYGTQAEILPLNHYLISSKKDVIGAGDVRSGSIIIDFVDVLDLDKDILYVLPVSIYDADIPVLRTRATNYYVFRGANLVNIVGYMAENYCQVDWPNPSVVTGMQQITMEMLVNVDWDVETEVYIKTLMGIEGYFLLRVGQPGVPNNQLEVAFSAPGLMPKGPQLPYNEWVHVAVTYDCASRRCNIYIDGVLQESSSAVVRDTFGSDGIDLVLPDVEYPIFHIGKSYNNSRWLSGCLSECRIWNRVLSAEELADPIHPYFVAPDSEGLVAYWKFNEGSGAVVTDRTGNGNDAIAPNPITWYEAGLPE